MTTEYTDVELAGEISLATERLDTLIAEAYRREASRKASDVRGSLHDLSFAVNALLGFVEAPATSKPTQQGGKKVELPETLTTSEVASMFGVKSAAVMALIKRGKLNAKGRVKRGHTTQIKVDDAFLAQIEKRGIAIDRAFD
jgi:hypothetical protein